MHFRHTITVDLISLLNTRERRNFALTQFMPLKSVYPNSLQNCLSQTWSSVLLYHSCAFLNKLFYINRYLLKSKQRTVCISNGVSGSAKYHSGDFFCSKKKGQMTNSYFYLWWVGLLSDFRQRFFFNDTMKWICVNPKVVKVVLNSDKCSGTLYIVKQFTKWGFDFDAGSVVQA